MRSAFSTLGQKLAERMLMHPRFMGFVALLLTTSFFAFLPCRAQAQNFADNSKWEIGGHYAYLHLPSQCDGVTTCEAANNGLGTNLTYNFSSWIGIDTEMNFFGNNGNASTTTTGGNVTEGLFGFRFGPTTRKWGLYSEVRPGFVNFSRVLSVSAAPNAVPGFMDESTAGAPAGDRSPEFSARLRYQAAASSNPLAAIGFTDATYFAFNYGEAIEYRPTKHAALRLDIGDTIVMYRGSTVGTPFHQHNFQISQAIVFRF